MSASKSLFARDDTFFGVCEALGQDFGINPNYLRVAFGVALLWNAEIVIGAYLAIGLLVMASRWLIPSRVAPQAAPAESAAALPVAENDAAQPELALAA